MPVYVFQKEIEVCVEDALVKGIVEAERLQQPVSSLHRERHRIPLISAITLPT